MVRRTTATIGLLLLALALPAATPAWAQFDTIFGNTNQPPRPPANIPPPPQQAPGYYPGGRSYPQQVQRPYQPSSQQAVHPDARDYRPAQPVAQPVAQDGRPQPLGPPADRDQPPAQPMPAPMNLPPSARPGGGTIETQSLAPPPGTESDQQDITPNSATPVNPAAPGSQQQQQQQQPGAAQEANQPPAGQEQQQGTAPPPVPQKPPSREVVVRPPPQRISNPTAVFDGLDKITGRVTQFKVGINETVQFGALQVTPKVCYSRPPTETPQTDAFVDVDEVTLKDHIRRIFTGWMFKASPGLNAVEHPIYDVWLINCEGGKNPDVADASDNSTGDDQASAEPAPKHAAKPAHHAAPPPPPPPQRPSAQSRGFLPAIR